MVVRKLLVWPTALAIALAPFLVLGAWAYDEEKVPLDKVPKAVLDTVKARFPGAELKGASKEDENGKIEYEIALNYKDHTYDVIVAPDGKLIAIEKTIAAKDLPMPVAAAVEAKYPKATIKLAEEITKDNKVTYEVHIVTAQNQSVEVVLDLTGKILAEESEKKEEKKKG
jgi:uncharacterized membrane protein YkoI